MASEAIDTSGECGKRPGEARLKVGLWALIMLLSCALTGMLVAATWIHAWKHGFDADTGIIAASSGGA